MAFLAPPIADGPSNGSGSHGSSKRQRFQRLHGSRRGGLHLGAAATLLLLLAAGSLHLGSMRATTTSSVAQSAVAVLSTAANPADAVPTAAAGSAAAASEPAMPAAAAAAAAEAAAAAAADAGSDAGPASEEAPQAAASASGSQQGAGHSAAAGATQQQQQPPLQPQQQQFVTWAEQQGAARPPAPDGPETEGLPCRASGYCSLGKLGPPYVGEVDSTEGYRKALAASCYRKECIHTTIGSRGHLYGLNLATSAWRLGLANVMIHAASRASCDQLAQYGYPNVTCVWSERQWFARGFDEPIHDWLVRYLLMARAVWMGYNVLMLDTDSFLYMDPYAYLKRAPLDGITWMSLQDNGALVNGGAQYIQSAQPGGPAAYTLASMLEWVSRYRESWEWVAQAHNVGEGHDSSVCMDQHLISDAIASNWLRHPFFGFSLRNSPHIKPPPGKAFPWDVVTMKYDHPGVRLRYPPQWHALAGPESHSPGFNLTLTWLNGTWDEERAGPRFPPRANFTQYIINLLEVESGGARYPDIEGSRPPNWPPFRDETWFFSPGWLLGTWGGRGHHLWDLGPPPPQVMIHVMNVGHWPGAKEYHMKASHAWFYEVAEAVLGTPVPAGTKETPVPKILALLPDVHLEAASHTDYRDKVGRFVKLAIALGRVLLLPEPVCNSSSWAAPADELGWYPPLFDLTTNTTHQKRRTHPEWLFSWGLDDDLHCVWVPTQDTACMPQAYTIQLDFREMLRRLPPGAGDPTDANTLQLQTGAADGAAGGGGDSGRRRRRLQGAHQAQSGAGGASLAAVWEAAKQKPEPPVLFLGAVPDLSAPLPDGLDPAADSQWRGWNETCSFMRAMPRGAWNNYGKAP